MAKRHTHTHTHQVVEGGRFILISTSRRRRQEEAPSGRALLRLLRQRPLLRGGGGALGEACRERLEPRAQRHRARQLDERGGPARLVEQAALARQAAVDPRDPARGLELGGGLALALEHVGLRKKEAARDERVGLAELARRGRLDALPEGLGGGIVAVGREEHVEGGLRALGHQSLHRPEVVLHGHLAVEHASLATVTVEHEEGERKTLRLAHELEVPREEDSPRAEVVPCLNDEREPREAAEGQLGEARVGARHVLEQRHARHKVLSSSVIAALEAPSASSAADAAAKTGSSKPMPLPRPKRSTSLWTASRWRRASASRNCRRASAESGASRRARYSGCLLHSRDAVDHLG
jgi:hypothetical protein